MEVHLLGGNNFKIRTGYLRPLLNRHKLYLRAAYTIIRDKIHNVIQEELYRNLGIASASVFVVTLILIANVWTSLMVFSCVVATSVNVCGFMQFWGLTIDTVTSNLLILAIGLTVDFSAHIGYCFMTLKGTRNGKYDKHIFFLVVLFGLFHGLVFLPVILSWFGPSPYETANVRYKRHINNNQSVNSSVKDDPKKDKDGKIKTPSSLLDEHVIAISKTISPVQNGMASKRQHSLTFKITPVEI
ncbi:hypothetical protein KUTeg_016215 [Tegillarca granosa]|uniref:Uncharacterized protein n=1 Tax=Tegillarca granosa TaxID=220873 RepID=A0ABQ9EQI7_TEGGR|nr:hypothetical protein KUTeg_016215 [Tegillarca granosa]